MASYRIVRHGPGNYGTVDGLFNIWHESRHGHEDKWYVNHRDFDETLILGGFPTKWLAVKWLKEQYEAKPDYLFAVQKACRECLQEFPADELTDGLCSECSKQPCDACDGTGLSGEYNDEEGALDCDECGGDGVV